MAEMRELIKRGGYKVPSVSPITGGQYYASDSKLGRMGQVLGQIITREQEKEKKRVEKLKTQFDMYKVLRDAGYEPKAAHEAVQKSQFPATPGGESLEREKLRLGTETAKTGLETAKLKTQQAQAALETAKLGKGLTPTFREEQDIQKDNAINMILEKEHKTRKDALRSIRENYSKVRANDTDIQDALDEAYPEEEIGGWRKTLIETLGGTTKTSKPKSRQGKTKWGMGYTFEP